MVLVIILLALAILLVIFTLQNSIEIPLHLFLWKIESVPLVLVLIATVLIGYIIASLILYPRLWKRKREYKKLLKRNKELEEQCAKENVTSEIIDEETNPEGTKMDDDYESTFF
jgi:uncharacterized integral membrane protein